ncbi:glucan biosynthesis protein, partial [Mycobacterium tuberculosis]|uniref:glucan biosynthesis protein n=1 Tax=Mycobacterium tuberculosis TaxID=1773 RepID=UPI00254EDECD
EEFPRFSEFWLQQPAPDARELVVLALLESRRATGAYRFTIRPGQDTVVQVQARLFLRAGGPPIATLGIAPLTSMFQHGENQPRPGDF